MRQGPAGRAAPVEAPVPPIGEHSPLDAVSAVDGGIVQIAVDLKDRVLPAALGIPCLKRALPILGLQDGERLGVVGLGLS